MRCWSHQGEVTHRRDREREGNLNVVDVLSVHRNLKLSGVTMGRRLGKSEED
jgi:hypothetical protein